MHLHPSQVSEDQAALSHDAIGQLLRLAVILRGRHVGHELSQLTLVELQDKKSGVKEHT